MRHRKILRRQLAAPLKLVRARLLIGAQSLGPLLPSKRGLVHRIIARSTLLTEAWVLEVGV